MAKFDSVKKTATVVSGDTLFAITEESNKLKITDNVTWRTIASWNDIAYKYVNKKYIAYIYPKQVIKLYNPKTSSSSNESKPKVVIGHVGRNAEDPSQVFVTWSWSKHSSTKEYEIKWEYKQKLSSFLNVTRSETDSGSRDRVSVYTFPADATTIWATITPIPSNEKTKWSGVSATSGRIAIAPIPATLSAPSVKVEKSEKDGEVLTATLDNIDASANMVKFEVYQDNVLKWTSNNLPVEAGSVTYTKKSLELGHKYKVRCRGRNDSAMDGAWSPYSQEIATRPSKASISSFGPQIVNNKQALVLAWTEVGSAESYEIQYSLDSAEYFDTDKAQSVSPPEGARQYTFTEPSVNHRYYVRVRAKNSVGDGEWSDVKDAIISEKPSAPTTWSSTTMIGSKENLYLYWVHNAEGETAETKALITLKVVVGDTETVETVEQTKPAGEAEKGIMSSYEFKMVDDDGNSLYPKGATLTWSVQTAGIANVLSEPSTPREVYIYVSPELTLTVTDPTGIVLGESICFEAEEIAEGMFRATSKKLIGTETPVYVSDVRYDDGTIALTTDTNQQVLRGQITDTSEFVYYYYDTKKLESFPIVVNGYTTPDTQTPISYHLSIIANDEDGYETVDNVGNSQTIVAGTEVYSKVIDSVNAFPLQISAADVTLVNGVPYILKCTVGMDSGLTAEASYPFVADFVDQTYAPTADVYIDETTYTAVVHPYCATYETVYYVVKRSGSYGNYTYTRTDTKHFAASGEEVSGAYTETYGDEVYKGTLADGTETFYCEVTTETRATDVLLDVYRREYNGSFTELASNLDGALNNAIDDPHPALDYARYRIVATSKTTGEVNYTDLSGIYVGGKDIIIQWDEESSTYLNTDEESVIRASNNSSVLKLPYNIDVTNAYNLDVTHVKYIGRQHPVSYHGTHMGESAKWNTTIPKSDRETVYALRRLASWFGNVYVREPSGVGYWATVKVSFSEKHCDVTIPVTIDITRVEGGA